MDYKTLTPFIFSILVLSVISLTPQVFANEIIIDDFSAGPVSLADTVGTCDSSLSTTGSVLGGERITFACRDSGVGSSSADIDTIHQEFLFRLNLADGSSGMVYDSNGALLGGFDLTDGGMNDLLRLEIISSDSTVEIIIDAVDQNGMVGQFSVMHGPSGFSTLDIPFSSIVGVDFTVLDFLAVTFIGSHPSNVDSDFLLGSISAASGGPEIISCDASLDGNQMVQPVVTDATGTAMFTLELGANLLEWNPISFADLTSPATTIKIHGPAIAGQNAPVELEAGVLSGGVPVVTTGSIMGSTNIDNAQKNDLLNELWYIVVRNDEFIGGEIRGQIICDIERQIGGTFIPIDTTALLLTSMQTSMIWWLPAVVIAVGAVAFFKTRSKKD